jgi:cyclopropane fatty-acyl-phospholipid synthase-like methyltransferase
MNSNIRNKVTIYYLDKFNEFGDTPKGADWNSQESQCLRFQRLFKQIDISKINSILDVGCGTACLLNFLQNELNYKHQYTGIDFVPEVINEAKHKFKKYPNVELIIGDISDLTTIYDFTVASGIFNVKQSIEENIWTDFIEKTLNEMFLKSKYGFSFNFISTYVDFTVDKLFYCNPMYIFEFCKKYFSKYVTIDHSYPLHEFTITVLK